MSLMMNAPSIMNTRIRWIIAFIAIGCTTLMNAQSSSDACGFNVANQYTVNSTCSFQTFNKPNSYVNNANPGGCSSSANDDAFGWFTATSTLTSITYDPLNNHDAILHVFGGACGSAYLACSNIGANGVNETVTLQTTIGTNYHFRVQRNGTDNNMDGSICIFNPASNDIPCTATGLTVNSSCTNVSSTNANSTGYAASGVPGATCAGWGGSDVWFSFVAPANGAVNLETTANGLTDSGMELYSATSCSGTFTSIECDDNDGPGNMSQINRTGLTAGATYYVRMWGNGGGTGTFSICAWSVSPTNDDPCTATSLTVGATCSSVSSFNTGATNSAGIPAPGCAAYSGADVWFSFVAPSSGSINIETSAGTLTDGGVAIYSATSCAGPFTLVSCDDSNGPGNMGQAQASGLTAGTTYYARVWGNGGATGTFNICAHALANDNPCGATGLTVGTSCTSVAGTNVNATTTTGPPAPGCAAFSSADVWFSFVAPTVGSIAIETSAGTLTDGGAAVYSAASCSGPFTLLACDDNSGPGNMSLALYNGLTAGTTYFVRVWGNGGATGTFNICAYALPNDNVCGATSLTVGTSCQPVTSTNVAATTTTGPPAPGCAAFSSGDVWFSFVAPAGGAVDLVTLSGSLTDGGLALYSAPTCSGALTLIACDDNSGPGNMSMLNRTGLTVGATYFVRVWGNGGATGTFSICVAVPIPNDNPCGAVSLTVNTHCTNTTSSNITATSTPGPPAPTCASYTGNDVWFSFVAPATGSAMIETTAGTMTDSGIELYSAPSCAGAFTSIECDDDDGNNTMSFISRTGLTPGQTYYVRVWGYNGEIGSFAICVYDTPAPSNDEPCAATSLAVGTTCSSSTYYNTNGTFTASIPDAGCGNYSSSVRDVWFSVVAPANGTVHFEMTLGTLSNGAMALYAATACGGTYSLVECDDNDGVGNAPFLYFYDLVPGATYYLRIWGNGGSQGTFNLCAVTAPTTADCFYALHLNDAGGDGWSGSTVGVSINGGAVTNYTLANGNRSMIYIPMNNGDIITLTYTAVGGFQNEISYILQSGYGVLFNDGPSPASGTVFAHANDCVAPDAPREDCYGGEALCAATGNSSNPASTGLKSDLNLHTRGCLEDDERQGTWFNFTVSAAGTIEFTIVPSNSGDDYDFALWGPSGSVSCPPTSTPYRCSYSGDFGDTGLSVASTDVSENASGDKFVQAIDVSVGEVYVLYVSNWSQSGLQFDLDFNMISGASIDCTVLPVELLTFEADALDRTVKLGWSTATESGSSHFHVQRSADGEDFEEIGVVDAAGTSFNTIAYGFTDEQPTTGTNYYRLKQVDTDGSFSYSGIATANFGSAIVAGTPYPNPTDGAVNVMVNTNEDGQAFLEVSDASGRTLHRSTHAITSGPNNLTADLEGLKPGTYMLTVFTQDGLPTRCGRFVVR